MNQQELEALLRQFAPNQQPERLEFSEGTESVEVEVPDPYGGPESTKKKQNIRTLTWVDRGTGQMLKVQVDPTTGTYTKTFQGTDPKVQGEPATTPAQQAAAAGASDRKPVEGKPGIYQVSTKTQRPDGGTDTETHYEDDSGNRVPTPPSEANKPQVVAGTLNTTSPQYAVVDPATGNVTWARNPNYQSPSPKPIDLPNTRTITWANPDGTITTEKNPNYVKKSKIIPHPSDPTKLVNVTEDDNGNDVILPVNDQTVIKPADLPVLQAKYGQIAQGLGALAQDLNSRFARGEITEKQKNDAFTAAHKQAETQVAEINTILDTSKSIWSGELTQRGQSLNETQSRRGFASDIFNRSFATGLAVGESAGPGHGKAIAAGVGAMMRMGQRYAEGMGGFRESPEVPLPAALQQARGIGIPGYEGAPGAAAGPPGAAAGPPVTGISDTTDAGGVPRVMTPGSATRSVAAPPGAESTLPGRPGAPSERTLPGGPGAGSEVPLRGALPGGAAPHTLGPLTPGQNPMLAAMQQQLMGGDAFGGSPVAAGGLGVYDPTQDVAGMVGDGADPTWAEAVRRAAGEVTQPGYAWQRFTQPASRYG